MKQRLVYALLLAAAILVTFQQVRGFAFLTWDDNINVTDHAAVVGASFDGLAKVWREPYANLYVPVAYTWFWTLAWISKNWLGNAGPSAVLFHGANLALHFLCAWFVFRILARIVAAERAAFVGALAFALHPLVVESVAWVTEARGLTSALLAFAALDLWITRATAETRGLPVRVAWRAVLATMLFALALLAKPQAAALPAALALVDHFVVGRGWKRVLPLPLVWSVLALGVFVLTKALQSDETLRFSAPLWSRPLVALDALGFYVWKTLVPLGLAADYGRTPEWLLANVSHAWPALIVVAGAVILYTRRSLRRWSVMLALFAVFLAPVLGLITFGYQDISTVADRYAYTALFAVALAVALALERAANGVQWTVAALIVALFATLSTRQADTWRDNNSLFQRVLEVNPRSWKANSNLALLATRARRLDEAVALYRRALDVGPSRWIVHQNLGLVLCQQQKFVEGEVELARSFALRRENLDVAAALGSVRLSIGKFAEAEEPLRVARELAPWRADVQDCLGTSLLAQGKDLESIQVLRAALALRDGPETRKNLAQALMLTGAVRESIDELRLVLQKKPAWAEAELDLAWLLATVDDDALRNGAEALALAERAVAASRAGSVRNLDTLAAAQAAVGRFEAARATCDEALSMLDANAGAMRERIEARRAAYARNEAWRGVAR
ncbi:MAG: tetratricopeptide repeat protein [Planctomycetes bacterium]|nr:tetratricopeptide repeat protein [Planctomycetota bacterium]